MTRYDLLRKRIAPIAFILGMGLLIRETCQGEQRIHATIVIDVGNDPRVRAIDATLLVGDEEFGEVHRQAEPGMRIGQATFKVALPEADAQLKIDVDLDGQSRHLTRRIHATEGATVTLDLAGDLGPR